MKDCSQLGLQVQELAGGNGQGLDELIALWAEYFPDYAELPANVDELRLAVLGQAVVPGLRPHLWLVRQHEQPVGMSFFLYNPARALGMLLFFALRPEARRLAPPGFDRLSDFLVAEMLAQVAEDGAGQALGLALEVDSPALAERYQHMGLRLFHLRYGEPSGGQTASMRTELAPQQDDFHPLFLGIFALPLAHQQPLPQVAHGVVLAFLSDYYGLPDTHPVLRQAIQTIDQGETWTT